MFRRRRVPDRPLSRFIHTCTPSTPLPTLCRLISTLPLTATRRIQATPILRIKPLLMLRMATRRPHLLSILTIHMHRQRNMLIRRRRHRLRAILAQSPIHRLCRR